jgi:hypothetical protein
MAAARLIRNRLLRSNLFLDLVDVIKVVSERGVDVGKSDGRSL